MNEYVERIQLEVNGVIIDDFEEVTENEVEYRKPVNLANKTGFSQLTARYGGKIKYAIPADAPEFNFKGIQGGTLTIDFLNGKRRSFTGVFVTKEGEATYGKDTAMKSIEWGAMDRVDQ
jgi:hypothetical protein